MNARERRVVLTGGGIVLAALTLRFAAVGVTYARGALDRTREATALTARARALVADGPARRALLRERAKEIVDLAPVLLSGASEAEAAAALAGEVNVVAARHRLAVSRLDPRADIAAGPLVPVFVRVHAESDLAGLYGFIVDVETGTLLLSFTELAISGQEPDAAVERLRLEGTVRGWMVKRAGAGGQAEAAGGSRR